MFIVGLNHKTAPIEIREKIYLNHLEADLLLSELKAHPGIAEAFVLSTCNRTEVYLKRVDHQINAETVLSLIERIKKTPLSPALRQHIFVYEDRQAIEHLFHVTCSLDSLVLGEKQILGQVKVAVERARDLGAISKYFNVLTNLAIRAGKKAQHETAISVGGTSVSWAAIEMAEQIIGSLSGKSVLVIGAGKMGELALENLSKKNPLKLYLMNRTGEKAEALAAVYKGIPASFWDIKEILSEVDLCICSAGAPHYLLDKEKVTKVLPLRQGNPLVFVDISMPRNIDPEVGNIPGVYVRSIDDLDQVFDDNKLKRNAAIEEVKGIIAQKIAEFDVKIQKLQSLNSSDFFEESSNTAA